MYIHAKIIFLFFSLIVSFFLFFFFYFACGLDLFEYKENAFYLFYTPKKRKCDRRTEIRVRET